LNLEVCTDQAKVREHIFYPKLFTPIFFYAKIFLRQYFYAKKPILRQKVFYAKQLYFEHDFGN